MIEELNGLDELPHGWIRTQLGEVAEIILGQSPPSSTYNEDRKGLPFYQGKLEFGKSYPTPRKWCMTPKKIAEKGDVLISVRAPVGPTNICPEKSCIGRGLAAIRGLGGIGTFFILYVLRALESEIARKGTGTTFSAIGGDKLKTLEIPLPPLNEQERIVAKLEELFARLDAGVEGLRKVKAQLKRYRQAVLKYAFEGKLTEEWRKTHKDQIEPATKLLERIKQERRGRLGTKYKEPPPIDVSGLQELPESWIWTRVGEISDIIHYGYTASSTTEPIGPKMLRITDIQADTVNWNDVPYCKIDDDTKQKYVLREGDLVFARTGATVGKSYLIRGNIPEAVFASYLIRIVLSKNVKKEFVYNFFHSPLYWLQIRKQQLGIGQPNVNSQILARIVLPLPSFPEQERIVEEIDSRLSVAEEIQKTLDRSVKESERLRQSILNKAFTGKLVPQDSSDEPADKLLERIKAERLKSKGKKDTNRRRKNKPKQLELSTYVK